MSVRMTVELIVSGTNDADAVESALMVRDGEYRFDIGSPVWAACQEAGIDAFDVETEIISYESDPEA